MSDAPPVKALRKRARLTVFLTVLLDLLGFGMILPILPFYGQQYGASDFQVGLLFASYSLAQLVCSPLLGRLSDRFGRRNLLLVSIAVNVVAHTVFAFAGSYWILVLARTASGVAASNIAIAQAFMADVTPRAERSKAMGLIGAAFGLGFVLGPAFGGLLSLVSRLAVPLGAAGLALVNLLLASLFLPESRPLEVRTRRPTTGPAPSLLLAVARDLPLFGLMTLAFVVTLCFAVMESTLALFAQARFGWGDFEISGVFVFIGVMVVVIQGGLIGFLVRRFGERRLVPAGIAFMAGGLLVMSASVVPPLLFAAAALLALGAGLHNPTYVGLLSRLADEESQGGVLGLSRSFSSLARVVGPLVGTWVFQHVGLEAPFLQAGVLMVVAFLAALWVVRRAALAAARRDAVAAAAPTPTPGT